MELRLEVWTETQAGKWPRHQPSHSWSKRDAAAALAIDAVFAESTPIAPSARWKRAGEAWHRRWHRAPRPDLTPRVLHATSRWFGPFRAAGPSGTSHRRLSPTPSCSQAPR